MPMVTVSKDHTHWVFYYPASTRRSGVLNGFVPGNYECMWFDPRSGQYRKEKDQIIEQSWKTISKPDEKDWCLVLKRRKCE